MQARNWRGQNWRKNPFPTWHLGVEFRVDEAQNKWALIYIPASTLECACREGFAFLLSKAWSENTRTDVFHGHLSLRCVFGWFLTGFILCSVFTSWQTFFKVSAPSLMPSPFPQVQLLKLFHNTSVHSCSCSCGSCSHFCNLVSTFLCYWDNKHGYFTAHGVLFLTNSWSYCIFTGAFIQSIVKCTVISN